MASIKIERLISVSSEDPLHPAQNLLSKNVPNSKWKCKSPGEKQAAVEFQLQEPSKIATIDVGNEYSAFIEVLVSKSCSVDDYKVLLVTSALMNLQDAKYGSNGNEVRFFKSENLCSPVKDEKWDRVKVICSQPYNKQLKYGLSFIVLHGVRENDSGREDSLLLGKFKLKDELAADPITIGGLFAKRKELTKPELKGAAAIRAASLPAVVNKLSPVCQKNGSDVNALPSSSGKDQNSSPQDVNKRGKNNSVKGEPKQKKPANREVLKNGNINIKPSTSSNGEKRKLHAGASTSDAKAASKVLKKENQKPRRVKPWNRLFDNVVFVISGFQNPLRSEIRSKGLAMGAKFKPDWDSSCTHLICAFVNTPKFNQVKGRGKIVRKEWIEECYTKRIRFPWRRYALDKNDLSDPVSEEEIFEEVENPQPVVDNRRKLNDSDSEDTEDEIERVRMKQNRVKKLKIEPKEVNGNHNPVCSLKDTHDVETDEIVEDDMMDSCSSSNTGLKQEKINLPASLKNESEDQNENKSVSIYDMETDNEEDSDSLPPLSDLFMDLVFYLHDSLKPDQALIMKRYIIAHKGQIRDNVDDTVNMIVCQDSTSLHSAKEHRDITFVKTEWVLRSHDENILLPTSRFEV